jgi:hypothetical protein
MSHDLRKLGTLYWFVQIGVGPRRIDLTHLIRTEGGGQDDKRQAFQLRVLLETLDKLKWQRQVEHDDIRRRGLVQFGIDAFPAQISQGFFAIGNHLEDRVEAGLRKAALGPLHLLGIGGNQ